ELRAARKATIGHAPNIHVLQRGRNDGNADPGGDQGKRRHHVRRFLSDARAEACCLTRGEGSIAHQSSSPVSTAKNECLTRKSLQRKDSSGFATGEFVALGQSHDQWLLQQWMQDESIRCGNVRPDESGVESIALYAFDQLGRIALG